jgi:thiamine-phosphate pyrophosphorylase
LRAIKESVNIPVVAIGGIGIQYIGSVMAAGVDGVAVISAILKADDCRSAAEQLLKMV